MLLLLPFLLSNWCMVVVPEQAGVRNNDLSIPMSFFCILIFFCGWILTRGANLQKYTFRKSPTATTFSFLFFKVKQEALGRTGNRKKILVSGWWGLSRHVNYAGEITQAIGLAPSRVFGYRVLHTVYLSVVLHHAICPSANGR